MIKNIALNSVNDATALNGIVSKINCDTWVHSKDAMVDAKSLLSLCTMVGRKDLQFVIPDDVDSNRVFARISKFWS